MEEENDFYSKIYSAVSDKGFLDRIISVSQRVLRKELKRDLNVFDAPRMSEAVMAMLLEGQIMLFLREFDFPVVDFYALREGIKQIIQNRLIEEQINAKKETANAN